MKTLVIQTAPHMILVNGIIVAGTFKEFCYWIKRRNINVEAFVNWPFVDGVTSTLKWDN
jgi:hypothetical protein